MCAVDPPPDEQSGETPLGLAAYENKPAVVKLLIERKANLNHQDNVSLRPWVVGVCVGVCVCG